MAITKKLPVGIESFQEIRTEGFYYVDKTGLIAGLLNNWGKVNLFTRPRRFGKSLNMDMLKTFFEYGCDDSLFAGLRIAEEKELCEKYMGKFPVISISLKDIAAGNYEMARNQLAFTVGSEAMRFQFLSESPKLSEAERQRYRQLIQIGGKGEPSFVIEENALINSLRTLSELLCRHYGQEVILLIDEYDVPLDKANRYGYYDEMIQLIQRLFSQALKTNSSVQFAVLTGCLRIAKESIFTGLNNMKVLSITDVRFEEYFGFLDEEVRNMLEYYGLSKQYNLVREWYDGYQFGTMKVYCPWDVINYVDLLCADPHALPQAFWMNTSGNDIIRTFLQKSNARTRRELERLVNGECIVKKINQNLTYRDLYQSTDHIWSVLFATGYLTWRGRGEGESYQLAIPNREIRQVFEEQILDWFQEEARKDTSKLDAFCEAFLTADVRTAQELFCAYLQKTISIRDSSVQKGKKESFYHGILLGLFSYREDWDVYSNMESGEGYSDILIETGDGQTGIVIEVKYADSENLEAGCREALEQIERMGYAEKLKQDGADVILKYGIACWKKRCMVQMGKA